MKRIVYSMCILQMLFIGVRIYSSEEPGKEGDYLQYMPEEMIQYIASRLDNSELLNLSRTSKYLQEALEPVIKERLQHLINDQVEFFKKNRVKGVLNLKNKAITKIYPGTFEQLDTYLKEHNITSIDLSENMLTELPETIGNLTYLKLINISGNNLTKLPETIGNLANLVSLHLIDNHLTELPETIGNLTNLGCIDI